MEEMEKMTDGESEEGLRGDREEGLRGESGMKACVEGERRSIGQWSWA